MFRKLALFVLVFAFAGSAFAADVVRLKNGKEYEGKVVVINPQTVELFSEKLMLKRIISKKDISVIEYENGETETFPECTVTRLTEYEREKLHTYGGISCCALVTIIAVVAIIASND